MTQKSELGAKGESAACTYLVKNGYEVVERNARYPWGEIDIVAKHRDGTLVFVEVKTLRQSQGLPAGEQLMPEDHMTDEKMERFRRTASLYAGYRHELVDEERGWRLDLVALTRVRNGFRVQHYENL